MRFQRRASGGLSNVLAGMFNVNNVAFIVGNICLFAAVGFASSMGSNLSEAGEELPELEPITTGGADGGRTRVPAQEYSVIASRNIFGVKPVVVQQEKKEAPTTLKLRLVGTNVSSEGPPFAIIEDTQKRNQDVFDLNQMVFNQAKLVQVEPERVKLERDGKIEILELQEEAGGGSGSSTGGIQAVSEDQTQFSVPEAELENALANLPQLLSQARAVPYFRNGKSVGMRLFAIRRGSLYEKLGLKNGDIIKAVNQNSLSDPTQALKLFEQLKTERNINVKVERSGQDVDLSYSIGG